MRSATALLLVLALVATTALVVESQRVLDPLAQFRTADGQLKIPGWALTPEVQRLLFGGMDPRPFTNLTLLQPERSPYPTMHLVPSYVLEQNLNVFSHPAKPSESWAGVIDHLVAKWFPPIDWHRVGEDIQTSLRHGIGWFFGLFTWDARAAVTVDTTTVTDVSTAAGTCTTSQSAAALDNGVLVLLSERGTTTFASVTYGSATLILVANTGANGGAAVRTEIWGFAGALPSGTQTMTATLSGGLTAKMTCATILLQAVNTSAAFSNGTSNSANSTNATITLAATVSSGDLGIAVASLQQTNTGAQPTGVVGTGAAATDLFGVAVAHCTTGTPATSNECAAGADIANPGTAITWTSAVTQWVVSAAEVVAAPSCGNGGATCYRIGVGGTWSSTSNWSNSSGGVTCGCAPASTDTAIFNANPTGTTTLAAATTIAGIDMTGFTGTLDTTAANSWALTINGLFNIQGTFLARNSTVTVTGNVSILTAGTIVNLGGSTWTVAGVWSNSSTSASWNAGTGTVTFTSLIGGTMTFAGASLPGNEFNNVTIASTSASAVTFTMATNGLRWGASLTISDASSTTQLVTSNLALTGGGLTIGNGGVLTANASTVSVTSVTMTGGTSGVLTLTTSSFTDSGNWNTSGAGSTFTKGSSTVTMNGVSNIAILNSGNNFNNLTISAAGTVTQTGLVDVSGTLTVNAGATLASTTFTLTVAALAANLAGGITGGASGTKTISGNVTVAAAGFFNFGGATWNFNGSWTNSSTSASWAAGSGPVTFKDAASQTMTFKATGTEFASLTFDASVAAGMTYTMATNPLVVSGLLTVQNSTGGATGNTILTTSASNLTVTAGSVTIGVNGTVIANGSTISVGGNWTATAANATFTAGTSTVILTATATINMTQAFNNLTVSAGTSTLASAMTINATLTVSGGTLAKSTFTLSTNALALSGGALTSTSGNVTVSGNVNISSATSYISFGSETWTIAGSWTNSSTSASWGAGTGTVTFNAGASRTMTFGNLTLEFGGNVTFNSGASTVTFTMATNSLRVGGTLTIAGGAGTTTLNTSGSNLAINAVTLNVNGGGSLTTNGSTITVTSIDTHLGAFTAGASTVVVNASGGTINITQTANNLTVNPGVSTTFTGSFTWSGTLTFTSAGTIAFGANTLTSSGAAAITFASATITMSSGNWDTSSATTFTATSSNVTFSGTGNLRTAGSASFGVLTVSGGTRTLQSQLTTAGLLTLSGGILAKGTNAVTANAGLSMSGGALTSTSGAVNIAGNATISAPASYISFGSESWTVTGSWTNSSTSASWSIGTASVTFNSSSAQTMIFAALPGNAPEFNNVTFNSGASTVTFTIATNALRWSGVLTVQGGSGTTTLATSNLGLNGGAVSVGNAGVLTANASTVSVSGVTMTGGTSGTLTLTTGSWAVAGGWNTSGGGSTFTKGTSTVTLSGAAQTVSTLNAANGFYNLVVSGTITQSTAIDVSNALTLSGTLTTSGFNVSGGSNLSASNGGTFTATTSTATFTNVTMTGGTSGTITTSGSWTVSGNWDTSGAGSSFSGTSSAVTMTGAAQTVRILNASNGFGGLTISGTISAASAITTAGLVTVSGTFDTTGTNYTLTIGGGLTVSGGTGVLRANASTVSIAGNVSVSNAAAYITSAAAGSWTVSGAWTDLSTSASWNFGAPVTFNSASSQTMTFGNLAQEFQANVAFNSGASTVTFTMATNALNVGGTLTIAGGGGTTTLNTSGSNLAINAVTLNANAGGSLTANGSSITVTSIDTHLGTFGVGTSTVVVNVSGGTVNVPQTVNNLTVNPTISTTFNASLRWTGALTFTSAGVLAFGTNGLSSSGPATMTFASATITMSTGSWDTSSAVVFNATGSTVTFSGTGTLAMGAGASFGAVTVSGGTRTLQSQLTTGGLLTLSGGILAKGTNPLTSGSGLTMSGGALTSTSGAVSVTGNVVISATGSYIAFGSEPWTVSGSWTNGSTSASWAKGSATVTFNSSSSQTMTFAALPGGAPEFDNVTFNSGASTVTFTMATNALVWSGTLAVQGGSGTTTLATSNLALSGGALAVSNAGSLVANASAVSISDLTMTGGTSGTITLTTGAWTVSGNWDTSGGGSAFLSGTSTVAFTGTSTTIRLAVGQAFNNLTISGTVSISSTVTAVSILTVNNGAVLTKTGQSLAFNALTENGTGSIADGAMMVVNFAVANSDPSNVTTFSVFSVWTVDSDYNWTDSSTVGTSTLTFTIGGNSLGTRFNVAKDGAAFASGLVNGAGQVIFTMLGSDPVVDVSVLSPCGTNRYWIAGTGSWSQSSHWASSSGGGGGCSVPTSSNPVFFDGNSGGGTATVNVDAALASLDTTGWTGTIAIGSFDFAVSGNIIHAAGTIAIGASSASGLTVAGTLTLSGSAILDGSGAASLVSIAGNTSIVSATAYFRMGSGTWTFSGSWSNSSTSASWAAGTGTVVFNAASSQTMTFASLAPNEFYNVTLQSSAGSGTVTFTMIVHSLRWANVLTIRDLAGSVTGLSTGSLSLAGGSLTLGNSGILTANASTVSIVNLAMNGGASGSIIVTTGTWTVSGNWNTSGTGSVFTAGSGTVTMSGAASTLAILDPSNGFSNLTISGAVTANTALNVVGVLTITGTLTTIGYNITGGPNLILSGGGSLIASTSSITTGSVTMNDAAANSISLTGGSITASGSWDTSGASSVFNAGTSTVTLSGTSRTLTIGGAQSFATLIISGSLTQGSQLTAGSLVLAAGSLTKGTQALTVNGDLTLSGGSLISTSGSVSVRGSVDISSSSSYIAFGSEPWTVDGGWTNASTSALWSAGAGVVTFDATTDQTMSFAGSNLPGGEFHSVFFNAGASTVSFTMVGQGLIAGTVTIQAGGGTTTLTTSASGLPITTSSLVVGSGGALLANGSTITVRSIDTSAGAFTAGTSTVVVNASGGSVNIPQVLHSLTVNPGITTTFASNTVWSAALILTGSTIAFGGNLASSGAATLAFGSSSITIGGSWDTGSATSFVSTGSTVTFTGSGQLITLGSGQSFATLVIAGTASLASDLNALSLTVSGSSTLTKTNYAITFNSLAVGGTIADGSVNVSKFTVTNSDRSAFVTIASFTAWSPGSSYAWTHTSSETSQTITWTISGNTPGYLYSVTKDGSAFAHGTVNGSGDVVFTMLGSDPNVQVTVVPPPVSAWWQTPYMFAIPISGIFVVFAMFVQRQRWRPAKAFLVDERNQLLREFTLDPSCSVTYEQAREAGALDAREKDVKVSKYHARTVQGDALSLVLLAYGPVSLDQVRFAQEMLVNIQDKFEDHVKAQIEEARTRDAELQATAATLGQERTELTARTKAFRDMMDALTIARSKTAQELADIESREVKIQERAAELAEERGSLDRDSQHLESLRPEMDQERLALDAERSRVAASLQELTDREAAVGPQERSLKDRSQAIASQETELESRESAVHKAETKIEYNGRANAAKATELNLLQTELTAKEEELANEIASVRDAASQVDADRKAIEARGEALAAKEAEIAQLQSDVESVKSNLGPREKAVIDKEADIAEREVEVRRQTDLVGAKALELQQDRDSISEHEAGLAEEGRHLADERGAFQRDAQALQTKIAAFEDDVRHRTEALRAQETSLGEARSLLAKEKEDFDAFRAEKSQWIASKDIELESHAQSLQEKQVAVRAQAEENAQHLAELAAREETLEIDSAKLDKAREELEARKSEVTASARDLENKTIRFREEEARKAEELRTWQTTLESEQALLKEQRETSEKDMDAIREAWAGRMLRVEQKEDAFTDREAKVQADVDWVTRNADEVAKKEKAAGELLRQAKTLQADTDRLRKDLEQRSMEIDSRERALREEAANQSIELTKRTETIQAQEAEFAGRKAVAEREFGQKGQKLEEFEAELQKRIASLDERAAGLASREARIASLQDSVREDEDRLIRERSDLMALAKQLEGKQLELGQTKERQEAEAIRLHAESDAMRQALAAKEADLHSERERLERESTSLQDTLGTKAKELAAREKSLAAQEDEFRTEEQEFEARGRELESRERQAQTQLAENASHGDTLVRREQDLTTQTARFNETVKKFETEAAAKRKEWEALQGSLKNQEAELVASAESRQLEIAKRMEDLEQRERSNNATLAQIKLERGRLDDQARAQTARQKELDGSGARSEKRFAELKGQEDELLRVRQGFEAERAAWIAKRNEELKQLEATRDASAEQTQQSERLIEDAQRRAFVAAEAEKAAQRQANELAAAQARLESRRAEAERAEKALQAQTAALQEESRKLGVRENDLVARARELEGSGQKLGERERLSQEAAEDVRRRRAAVDQDGARLEKLASELERRRAELEARQTAMEGRLGELAKRDQLVTTELQRADNLMEDLTKKEAEIGARAKEIKEMEAGLRKREAELTQQDVELRGGMQSIEQMRKEHQAKLDAIEQNHQASVRAKDEAASLTAEADRLKAQSEAMQAEVTKNMRFLQKKALDVLDREERVRLREVKAEEEGRLLEARGQILEGKERQIEADQGDMTSKLDKVKAENEKLKGQLRDAEKNVRPVLDMEEWKKDIENRVKIIQRKALELLDREEKLRKREEDHRALAKQLGVSVEAP